MAGPGRDGSPRGSHPPHAIQAIPRAHAATHRLAPPFLGLLESSEEDPDEDSSLLDSSELVSSSELVVSSSSLDSSSLSLLPQNLDACRVEQSPRELQRGPVGAM